MAKKYYAVNCHYDMVITVDVVAESEQEAIEKAKSNADFADINKWAECYGSSECIAEEQDLTNELQQQVDEQQAMFDKKDIDILERLEAIKQENGDIVSLLIPKAIKNGQTIYGELSDWLRDYHNDLPLKERDMLAKLLLGDMVVQHPDYISRVKPNKVMVLCSYDEDDNDTDVHLVVSKHQFDTDKEGIREAIEGMWDLDLYTEEDLDELRECISDLLKGDNGYFGSEYYWEEKDCVL